MRDIYVEIYMPFESGANTAIDLIKKHKETIVFGRLDLFSGLVKKAKMDADSLIKEIGSLYNSSKLKFNIFFELKGSLEEISDFLVPYLDLLVMIRSDINSLANMDEELLSQISDFVQLDFFFEDVMLHAAECNNIGLVNYLSKKYQ